MTHRQVFRVIFLILLFPCPILFGQRPENIDSLKTELSKAKEDTTKVNLMILLSMKYQSSQPDSAMAYVTRALDELKSVDYPRGKADALLHMGRLKRDQSKPAEALPDMFAALELYRKINDYVQIANSLNDISIIYANSGDFAKSLDYFKQALEIFKRTGDEKGESYALNNIGIIYQEMDSMARAKDYFLQSLHIKEKNNDYYGISRGYTNMGSIEENDKNWTAALDYYVKAEVIYRKTNDTNGLIPNHIAIARVKEKQGKINEAIRYATMALDLAKKMRALSGQLNASELLSGLEEKSGNFKAALGYQKLYNVIADSLENEEHTATLEEMKGRFNVEEKEREITLLKKDKELQAAEIEIRSIITYSLLGGIILMLLILALVYYAYRTAKRAKDALAIKNEEIEAQKNNLDKINREKDRFFSILSHDLRGPLNSLKGFSYLITEHVDELTPAELKQMRSRIDTSLDNLTELINNILEWSMSSLGGRKLNFGKIDTTALVQKNITLYRTIAEDKGVNLLFTPGTQLYGYGDFHAIDTVVRNLLSNSIKFSHPGKDVVVTISQETDTILISVKDEGIGMPKEIQEKLFSLDSNVTQLGTNNEKGSGFGLTLCKELMRENQGDILVKSVPGQGSEFITVLKKMDEASSFNA